VDTTLTAYIEETMKFTIKPVTAKAVLAITGPTPSKSQLMRIADTIIRPYREAEGTGSNRLFDFENLVEIGIWQQLHSYGMKEGIIKIVMSLYREQLSTRGDDAHGHGYLAVNVAIGGASDSPDGKYYIKADIINEADITMIFRCSPQVSQRLQGTNASVVLVDLAEIRKHLQSFFDSKGELLPGLVD
jgi:hypothetical protein